MAVVEAAEVEAAEVEVAAEEVEAVVAVGRRTIDVSGAVRAVRGLVAAELREVGPDPAAWTPSVELEPPWVAVP